MGCHTWVYANENDRKETREAKFPFIFRVFDYQDDILRNYEQAKKFVLETYKHSTNDKPMLPEDYYNKEEDALYLRSFTAQMKGKILFASPDTKDEPEVNEQTLSDPTTTLKRLKEFFKKYPNGVIEFG